MSATQQTLAQLVRSKYPGAYDDIDDASLEGKVLEKYPQYSDLPRTANAQARQRLQSIIPNQAPAQSIGQKADKWWTTPTQTTAAGNVPGVEQDIPGATNSPRQTFQRGSAILAAEGAPALVTSAIAAPLATGLGLGGSAVGGYAGSKAGRAIGQGVESPELGEDIGGTAGSVLGGGVGSKVGSAKLPWDSDWLASKLRNPATARQSQLGKPGTVKNILPSFLQKYTVPEALIPKGELGTPTNPGPFNEIPSKMPQSYLKAPPWETPAHQEFPLGSEEYPGPFSKVPNKVPAPMRGDPFVPPAQQTPFTAPIEAQSAEGVKGSIPKPSGRLVLLPEEVGPMERMQALAKKRASEHGMLYAAGMRPAGGGRVPMTPTGTMTQEASGLRGSVTPFPATPALKVEADSLGIRWAVSPEGYRVSIPKSVPDEAISEYAAPLLEEQARAHSSLPWMKGAKAQ
jgi:hypothetical protein